jgi:WD40 repeat protein
MLLRHLDVGHQNVIVSLAYSPDGSRIISGSWDGTAKIWDTQTGRLLRTLDWGASKVSAVDWSRDGQYVAVAAWPVATPLDADDVERLRNAIRRRNAGGKCQCDDSAAIGSEDSTPREQTRVFNAVTGEQVHVFDGLGEGVAFSPDGRSMAVVSWTSLIIVDRADWNVVARFDLRFTALRNVMYSEDGSQVACVEGTGVFVFDSVTARPCFVATDRNLFSERLEPGDTLLRLRTLNPPNRLESGSEVSYLLQFWKQNLWRFRPWATAGDGLFNQRIAFSPTGTLVAVRQGSGFNLRTYRPIPQGIALLDADTSQIRGFFESPDEELLRTIAFAPDGKHMATAGDLQAIFVRDVETQLGPRQVGSPPPEITSFAYSPDGHTLAAGTSDGTVTLVDPTRWSVTRVLRVCESPVVGVEFSPSADLILATSQDGRVRLWTLPELEFKFEFWAHKFELVGGTLSADGGHFVSVGYADPPPVRAHDIWRAQLVVWSLHDGRNLYLRELPDLGPIRSVTAASDRGRLAISFSTMVLVADTSTTPTLRSLLKRRAAEYDQMAFSPSDDSLLVANVFYNMLTIGCGDRAARTQFSAICDGPTSLAYNPDGFVLARGTAYCNAIEVYQMPTGEVANYLVGHQNSVTALRFSLDGTTLVSGGADGTIKVWDVQSGTMQASILVPSAEGTNWQH